MLKEFKEFISEGNLMELAVAFIMGLAIKAVIDSLVNDVIMGIIAVIVGKPSFNDLVLTINGGVIYYGRFISEVVNFLIIAVVIFFMMKAYTALVNLEGRKPGETVEADEIALLTEIRDSLRARP